MMNPENIHIQITLYGLNMFLYFQEYAHTKQKQKQQLKKIRAWREKREGEMIYYNPKRYFQKKKIKKPMSLLL